MRWHTKQTPLPKEWAERSRFIFAWLPTLLDNGDKVWLEHYESKETYLEKIGWKPHKRLPAAYYP
jgi:hypothetical protein